MSRASSTAPWTVLTTYFRELFGLLGAGDDEVRAAVNATLDVHASPGAVRVSWSLVYAAGSKAP